MCKLQYLIWFLFIISISCTSKSGDRSTILKGSKYSGKVISIIDGDTYDILLQGNRTIRVRMEGIDAPEKGMPFYRVSKNHLSELCFNEKVKIIVTGIDDNNRILAYSYIADGKELGQEMVKEGMAWHFKKYNSDSVLSNLEIEARKSKKGIWIDDNPMPPWENRRLHRNGISTKDSFNIKENQR